MSDLTERLRKRASIRRSIPRAKDGQSDRISDILEEAADRIDYLEEEVRQVRSQADWTIKTRNENCDDE